MAGSEGIDPYYLDLQDRSRHYLHLPGKSRWTEELQRTGNIVDPGLMPVTPPPDGNYDVSPDTAAHIDFEPIQFERIGLYLDEYRTSLP